MKSDTASTKGDALEDAVRAIETAIIRSFPGYSESAFRIEGKKILIAAGVRHEIDIYVTANLGPGYESVFVFECKNWQDKVGKNEIIVFSEKVRASSAQRGFFVAKSFTADAVAQAAQDSRLELLLASELDPSAVMVPGHFHAIGVGKTEANVEIRTVTSKPDSRGVPLDFASAAFELDGERADLKAFVDGWVDRARHARCDRFPSAGAAEGVHVLEFSDERSFEPGQASVNGVHVSTIRVSGTVQVEVTKAVVVSAFEVATRGRVISVQIGMSDVEIAASFVQLSSSNPPG